jgi:16S rRNA (guanine(966)-N(2))-methyltransferase RsmD
MSVRVIAGSAKGRRLAVPDVTGLRPTGDRARETLFNILMPRIEGATFLDAFAGSGAVGIEALSRGSRHAAFVERNRAGVAVLRANLESCGFLDCATIVCAPWRRALRRLARAGLRFDIAFFDPPYHRRDAHTCLEDLRANDLLAGGGIAVIEHRAATPPRVAAGWERQRRVDVGDTSFSLFGIISTP